MKSGFKLLIFSLLIFTLFGFVSNAQTLSSTDISIASAPTYPTAGETAIITLSTYAGNLDTVLITWFVNGKKISSSIGMKSFSTAAPASGSTSTIRAVMNFPSGEVEKSIVLRPTVMTLLWQATDSYVPPFYRGKAMPTADTEIKLVAIPEVKTGGTLVSPKNMLYSWKKNYAIDPSGSGYGKNYFKYTNDYLENLENISVEVSTLDGKFSSQANINIAPSTPQISFYKNDSLLGTIWEQALKNGHKIVGYETIVAEPYFLSPKETWHPNLSWGWYLNGDLTNNIDEYRKNWLPVSVEGGVSGVANIGIVIENNSQLLGGVERSLNVEF